MTLFQVSVPVLSEIQEAAANSGVSLIDNLGVFVSSIVGLFLIIASLATILYLVWGGLKWITAGSDAGKVEEARQQISNAILGLAIVASSWAIFLILNYFFGLGIVEGSGNFTGNPETPAPAGFCYCGGGTGCAANGTIAPVSYAGNCYQCQADGSWDYFSGPDHASCPDSIVCNSCP